MSKYEISSYVDKGPIALRHLIRKQILAKYLLKNIWYLYSHFSQKGIDRRAEILVVRI